MALFFLIPKFIWHTFTRRGGLNIRRLVSTVKDKHNADKGVEAVKNALKYYFDTQNRLNGTICCGCRCPDFYLGYTLMYFTVKILYVINTIVQFFLLNAFLSFNFTTYGAEGLAKLFSSEHWMESPRFPLVTMCDFMVRRLGSNQHWYAIQCNLPINLFNEKIFLGIWIWLIVLTLLNILSIISWIIALTKGRRLAAIKKYLRISSTPSGEKESLLSSTTTSRNGRMDMTNDYSEFNNYMHTDGFLIFQIIANNTNELAAVQIIEHLYRSYEPRSRNQLSNV
jgi:hypothetical protein